MYMSVPVQYECFLCVTRLCRWTEDVVFFIVFKWGCGSEVLRTVYIHPIMYVHSTTILFVLVFPLFESVF